MKKWEIEKQENKREMRRQENGRKQREKREREFLCKQRMDSSNSCHVGDTTAPVSILSLGFTRHISRDESEKILIHCFGCPQHKFSFC